MSHNMHYARAIRNDEFYTSMEDIQNELRYYWNQFDGKVVYSNCDLPNESNFIRYFLENFRDLNLKTYYASGYIKFDVEDFGHKEHDTANLVAYDGYQLTKYILFGDGDFRSHECYKIFDKADIIVTNPPFSLFREYLDMLMRHDKKFLIIGNVNAITYRNTFKYIQEGRLWLGKTKPTLFHTPEGDNVKLGSMCRWFTNMDRWEHDYDNLMLSMKYDPEFYPKYDNFDAINVDKVKQIPKDYPGVMGVPITFMDHYNPEQFEIIGTGVGTQFFDVGGKGLSEEFVQNYFDHGGTGTYRPGHPILGYYKDGEATIPYLRILIRRKERE